MENAGCVTLIRSRGKWRQIGGRKSEIGERGGKTKWCRLCRLFVCEVKCSLGRFMDHIDVTCKVDVLS